MTICNQCEGRMVPDPTAIVPVLACEDCGRMIPLPPRKAPRRSTVRRRELAVDRARRRTPEEARP